MRQCWGWSAMVLGANVHVAMICSSYHRNGSQQLRTLGHSRGDIVSPATWSDRRRAKSEYGLRSGHHRRCYPCAPTPLPARTQRGPARVSTRMRLMAGHATHEQTQKWLHLDTATHPKRPSTSIDRAHIRTHRRACMLTRTPPPFSTPSISVRSSVSSIITGSFSFSFSHVMRLYW